MNLLENINSFLVESSRNSKVYHNELNKHHYNLSKINILEKKLKGGVLPLSEGTNITCIETDNLCNNCTNLAGFVSTQNSRIFYCWKHSLILSEE